MHEYALENGQTVNAAKLQAGFLPVEQYAIVHRSVSFVCHDVVVKIGERYLLIERDNMPAKGILWPLGGRLARGIPAEESAKTRIKEESGLAIKNLTFLGVARTLFDTDPFGHHKGTDTVNLMYLAEGEGDIVLDNLHTRPTLFTREQYANEFRDTLHPYVVEIMDKALEVNASQSS